MLSLLQDSCRPDRCCIKLMQGCTTLSWHKAQAGEACIPLSEAATIRDDVARRGCKLDQSLTLSDPC